MQQNRWVNQTRDCFSQQHRILLIMLGKKCKARGQPVTLFDGVQKGAVKRGQPTSSALQRFMEGCTFEESLDDDRQGPSEGSSGRRSMLDLDGLWQADPRRRELAELLVEFRPLGMLPWSNEK